MSLHIFPKWLITEDIDNPVEHTSGEEKNKLGQNRDSYPSYIFKKWRWREKKLAVSMMKVIEDTGIYAIDYEF